MFGVSLRGQFTFVEIGHIVGSARYRRLTFHAIQ